MSKLRWTLDTVFRDAGRQFRAARPGEYDVPEGAADEYLDHRSGGWERVDDSSAEADADADEAAAAEAAETAAESSDDDEGFDMASFLDRAYTERVDAVESGKADGHLDALHDEETSETVKDAIESRWNDLNDEDADADE